MCRKTLAYLYVFFTIIFPFMQKIHLKMLNVLKKISSEKQDC